MVVRVGKEPKNSKDDRAARLRKVRQEQLDRERRVRTAWVTVAAVTMLLIAAVIGVGLWKADQPDEDAPAPVTAPTEDPYGLPVGSGPVTVEIFSDFMCPACAQFDQMVRPVLADYLADDTITLVYRPIAIMDRATTTNYSTRAAAAAGCAADGGAVDEFFEALMTGQPSGSETGYSDDEIIEIGTTVGLDPETFGQCVQDGTYRDWVRQSTNDSSDRGVPGTPTVFVDGDRLPSLSVDALVEAVDAAAATS